MDNANNYSQADKEKWLHQRGWRAIDRNGIVMWRDPERGVSYNFIVAIKMALADCRLPADFNLTPGT
jgi:hypothetical protein